MKKLLYVMMAALALGSCGDKGSSKKFEVSGKISNSNEKIIYLEEIPMTTMQRIRVDSSDIKADGSYTLEAATKESSAYTIRIGNNDGPPLAAIINDAPKITVNATFVKGNNYAETYEVKGSKASMQLKDFMIGLNSKLQSVYFNVVKADSIKGSGGPDSVANALVSENQRISLELRQLLSTSLQQSEDPALTMFELGNYQAMANNPAFNLQPVTNEEVNIIVNETVKKFPSHSGLLSIKQILDNAMNGNKGWIGKQAPEIALPDPNGKIVTLSSYKGKYVLVDFWASWCGPCRRENPNVVAAYNKFKGKNFDILGVSLDKPDGREDWLHAIKNDKLAWTQISDLKHWESAVVPVYGFAEEGIPYNILVDPNGTIIAERLTGSALENKLSGILK